ncbi:MULTISPECIES: metallophosphoesterase family protein [Halocynthiibacter]|uniref:Metallophosphoesterase n=1 Tax=Halocynthiibacter halioticoli TaxID=2986804 RepID=A0AAE3LSQ0_9RHOB|nr:MULTISPECIES: metallophosphoesterase [Halocynthiibacter]MCV6825809.1 metallophosphoesterase [Halocynthiibacter halioticoli]MCW4058810.1 metallophosphoesterase [Halocynthiibacter sp. SDUM655004]
MRFKFLIGILFWAFATVQVSAESIRIVVISDLNGSYGSTKYSSNVHKAIDAIIALNPDLVLSTGDMVAGQRRPALSENQVRAMWRAFHDVVTEPLERAGIPLAVTPGNHDGSAYSGFEAERRIYADEWKSKMPKLNFTATGTYPFFYAFDIGAARIVSIDATTIGELDRAQMSALSTVFDGAGPARIVFSHLPLWPFTIERLPEIIGDPELEQLLDGIGVDLYLSGHHHAYYPGQIDAFSVVSQAELGGGSRRLIGTNQPGPKSFTVLEIENDGTIHVSALKGPDFTTVIDTRTLPERLNTPDRIIRRIDTVPSGDVMMKK